MYHPPSHRFKLLLYVKLQDTKELFKVIPDLLHIRDYYLFSCVDSPKGNLETILINLELVHVPEDNQIVISF